jgi:hypothetical protein
MIAIGLQKNQRLKIQFPFTYRLEYQMASMTEAKKADPKELNLARMKVNWMAQMWERHWDASKVQLSESKKAARGNEGDE